MKAWICREFCDPMALELTDIAVPETPPGHVQIRVRAAGLSFGETLILRGGYQKTPPLPYVPSSEMAGIVEVCGEGVSHLKPGDRVAAFSVALEGGGLAEYCSLPQEFVHSIPDNMGFPEAAGFLMNHWTAFHALVYRAYLQKGETLVVHGATGGTGAAAIDVARAIGARIIATGSNDDRLNAIAADHRINHTKEDMRQRILELTEGRGADVYFDPVGGDLFDQSMRAIAPGGRILVVGVTSGRPALARTDLVLVKMISIIGVEGRLAIEKTGQQGWNQFREMLSWASDGRISPGKTSIIPFEDAPRGYEFLLSRKHSGKCVVVL